MHKSIVNLIEIQKEIYLKKKDSGKQPKIIAVTKTFSLENILPLIDHGHLDFGENKVQEAIDKWTKIKAENKNLNLHMIGKLQTNKVKFAVKIFDYIHSLDSIKLARKISEEQKKIQKNIKLFIQINIGKEKQKSGILIEDLKNFYMLCSKEFNLNIIGLMCLPPNDEKTEEYFIKMKQLNEKYKLEQLSMGMSNDYKLAIKNGSTFLRIGSKIFGNRIK